MLGAMLTSFLLGFATIILLCWYSLWKQNYWKKKGIPYATPFPFLGSVFENFLRPFHDNELNRYRKLGRIYGHYEGNRPLLSVAEPNILRNIFVKDFQNFSSRRRIATGDDVTDNILTILQGEDWKRIRSILTPTFTTGKIKRMLGIFKECAKTLVENFKDAAEKDKTVEVKSLYGAFTMDVIASCAFSTKIDSHKDPNNKFAVAAQDVFTRTFNWRFMFLFLAPKLMKFLKIPVFSQKGMNFFRDVTLQIIQERKQTGQKRNDFLQLLLESTEEISDEDKLNLGETETEEVTINYGKNESRHIFSNINKEKSLSFNELLAQCITFFLAGYDTTASTLAFASYLLAVNPECQEKLIKEIDEVVKENQDEITYEAVQNMKYLDNVISETLRLYPTIVRLERVAEEDYRLGDTGIVVPKGMIVTMPIYAIHRDSCFFPDPEIFDPDRFSAEKRSKRDPYVYIPFGAGPRNCIGMRFALIQMKVCLAYVLRHFRIKRCPQTKVPLDFCAGQGLLQAKDVTLQMEARKDAAVSVL